MIKHLLNFMRIGEKNKKNQVHFYNSLFLCMRKFSDRMCFFVVNAIIVCLFYSSCSLGNNHDYRNIKKVELDNASDEWYVYEFFQNFKLNMSNGKYHSVEKLPSGIFPNGIKFYIGNKGLYCICTDVLNSENEMEKGVDFYLISELVKGKSIKEKLNSHKKYNTLLSMEFRNFLKRHSEIELRNYFCGIETVEFSSSTSIGYIFFKKNECNIYCFSKKNNNCVQLTLIDKYGISNSYSLLYEALNIVENIYFN